MQVIDKVKEKEFVIDLDFSRLVINHNIACNHKLCVMKKLFYRSSHGKWRDSL